MGSTPIALIQQGQTYRIYADQIDTARVLSDASGKILWSWESKPFGETTPNEDPDQDGVALRYNQRFPGQIYDAETGLHYNFYRDYNPQTGRYVQSDPIGLEGGMNSFGYVNGKPLSLIDINGLAASFATLWSRYQDVTENGGPLPPIGFSLQVAGGQLWTDFKNGGNTCAVRLSNAFNRSGEKIPKNSPRVVRNSTADKNGNYYLKGAYELAAHLQISSLKQYTPTTLQGKKGIIYFENYHIDLWNGLTMRGNGAITSGYTSKKIFFKERP